MVRACQSMPPSHGWGLVSKRRRSPPLLVRLSQSQHTTVVCGGGGLKQDQPAGADERDRGGAQSLAQPSVSGEFAARR
jgi:hypothetical protein